MNGGYGGGLTVVAAVGAGLVAGVYLTFSTFVMQALRRLPGSQGLVAMQAVNRAAPTSLFMLALFGTALACASLGVWAATRLDGAAARLQLAGALSYLLSVGMTMAYHVPRNDALAGVDPTAPGAVDAWRRYASAWTTANHLRTLSALVGAVCLVLALRAD